MTSNGIVKYEIRFVFNRSQGANHPLRGDTESCEPFELEFFIDRLAEQSDVLKKCNGEMFQKFNRQSWWRLASFYPAFSLLH
jgi:hypothetical protein